jgi:hypothetical protein
MNGMCECHTLPPLLYSTTPTAKQHTCQQISLGSGSGSPAAAAAAAVVQPLEVGGGSQRGHTVSNTQLITQRVHSTKGAAA